jgi:alkylhydroperoxidase family enzyme
MLTIQRQLRLSLIICLLIAACSRQADEPISTGDTVMTTDTFSTRLQTPRIAPIAKDSPDLDEAQRAMLADRPDYNLYKTLVHHVELYNRWTPLGRTLLNASTLPARDREIIMLRMGWLCQAEYEWAQHARIATADNIGMTDEEVRNIAVGVDAGNWSDWEKTLITMVDELRYETMISDSTWKKLNAKYSKQETMDALFTAAQYQLVSMALNSIGIQLDPILNHRLLTDLPLPSLANIPSTARLSQPRLAPILESEWTERQRELIQAHIRDGGYIPNLYSTMLHHPDLFGPRYTFGSYLQRDSNLPAKTRELLIMRTGWLIRAEYEWAHHDPIAKEAGLTDAEIYNIAIGPDAPEWSEEYSAVLKAADELRREAFISDPTWNTLTKYYDNKQLLEIIFTVGGYTMTGLAINSFGIQVEEGYPLFPNVKSG